MTHVLLYDSASGKVWKDTTASDFTTIGSTRILACELAEEVHRLTAENVRLREALEEIASFPAKGVHGEEVIEVGIAKDALKP